MFYEDRVLAFFDILGFSEEIGKTIENGTEKEDLTNKIYSLLEEILDFKIRENHKPISGRVVSHFSDSVAISYPMVEEAGVINILSEILFLCYNLLQKGFLVRGAITCDKLYHKEEKIFGPAMITAVDMEEKIAIYPRIIFDNEILNIAKEYPASWSGKTTQSKAIESFIAKDFDDLYYLDYFQGINYFICETDGISAYFKPLREMILNLQKKTKENYNLKSKYLWLKAKYNTVLEKYKKKYVNDKAKTENPELYDFLEKATGF